VAVDELAFINGAKKSKMVQMFSDSSGSQT